MALTNLNYDLCFFYFFLFSNYEYRYLPELIHVQNMFHFMIKNKQLHKFYINIKLDFLKNCILEVLHVLDGTLIIVNIFRLKCFTLWLNMWGLNLGGP